MTGQIQLHVVLARLDVQALERPVEVVHDSGVVPVDVDLRLPWRDLHAQRRRAIVVVGICVGIRPWSVAIVRIPYP
jgi:hypothetical protein